MQAYNKNKLENGLQVIEARRLFKMKFISKEQLTLISRELTQLQTNSIFVRFGFFLLGSFLISSLFGFISMIFTPFIHNYNEMLIFINAAICLISCELLAKKGYHRHGLDDAFILAWQGTFCVAIGMMTESFSAVFATLLLIGLFSCIRYVNTLSALFSCIGLVGFFVSLIIEVKVIGAIFLPFVGLVLATIIFAFFYQFNKNTKHLIYHKAFQFIKIFSLVLAYVAINYLVVRELSEKIMGSVVKKGTDIPLAFVFYGLTFILPMLYIYFGLFRKDRPLLTLGFFTLALSFLTIRYYYSFILPETALLLTGFFLFLITFFVIKKIKDKDSGITFQPDRDTNSGFILNAQALIINSQIHIQPNITTESKMPFGGGGYSGGGSGGDF